MLSPCTWHVEAQSSDTLAMRLACTLLTILPLYRVTELEAQRLEEGKEDRDAFRRMLREEIEKQAREKNIQIKLPPDKEE